MGAIERTVALAKAAWSAPANPLPDKTELFRAAMAVRSMLTDLIGKLDGYDAFELQHEIAELTIHLHRSRSVLIDLPRAQREHHEARVMARLAQCSA